MSKEADKRLASAMDKINKTFGKGSMGKLGSMEGQDVERFSSGSIDLDHKLGGGYPIGRMIEIYGPESSGKTTLTIHAVAQAQKLGHVCAFIDMEHAFDPEYATNLGVNIDELLFTQPDSGDDAWDMIMYLLNENAVDLIVIDSVAAMQPKKIIEGGITDANIGLHAKLMSIGITKARPISKKNNITMFFINQLRANIGVMYGPKEKTTGGFSLKFAYSQRIEVRKVEAVKDGDIVIANKTRARVVKNKTGAPAGVAHFNIVFGQGINRFLDILEACIECDIINKNGSWYSYDGTNLGQGKIKTREALEDNPELVEELELMVKMTLYPEEDKKE